MADDDEYVDRGKIARCEKWNFAIYFTRNFTKVICFFKDSG